MLPSSQKVLTECTTAEKTIKEHKFSEDISLFSEGDFSYENDLVKVKENL